MANLQCHDLLYERPLRILVPLLEWLVLSEGDSLRSNNSTADIDEAAIDDADVSNDFRDVSAKDFDEWIDVVSASQMRESVTETPNLGMNPHGTLLRESLLTHHWQPALPLVKQLLKTNLLTNQGFHQLGLSLCEETSQNLCQDLEHWTKAVQNLCPQSEELCLQHCLAILTNDIEDTNNALQALHYKTRRKARKCKLTCQQEKWKDLVEAYKGLMNYAIWNKQMEELKKGHDFDDMTASQSTIQLDQNMERSYQKVCSHIEDLKNKPGVWDIFISKYANIMDYYGEADIVLSSLTEYADNHSNNHNSHRLLYQYMRKYDCASELYIPVLRNLADLAQSDQLVIDLCEILFSQDLRNEGYTRLFNLLDYAEWQCKPQPWCLLYTQLGHCKQSDTELVNTCWSERMGWWPAYHFCVESIQKNKACSKLLAYKSMIAAVLLGENDEYCKACLQVGCDRSILTEISDHWVNKERGRHGR